VRLVVPIVKNMIFSYAVAPPPTPATIDSTYSGGTIAAPELLKVAPPGTSTDLCYDNDPSSNPVFYRVPVTAEAVVRMQTPFKDPGQWTAP
jgi:hypothetical protein